MTDTTDVVHCPTCGQRGQRVQHRTATSRTAAAVCASWIAACTLALVAWLLNLVAGPTAASAAVVATALLFIVAILAAPKGARR